MSKITFELEGKEYKIPTHLTINDYVKVFKVKDLFEDDYFAAKLISIVTGADMTKLLEADREKVGYVFEQIYKILPLDKPGFIDRFTLDGVEYGFIPSWKKMSFGEFADLDTLMTKKPDEVLDYLHIITAILYRPITKSKSKHNFEIEKYNQNTMDERSELFKNKLDIEVALGAQFFFTQFARIYSNYTPISLKMWMKISWIQIVIVWRLRKLIWKRIVSPKDLDGSLFSTEFARMILQDIHKFLTKQS